MCECPRVRGIDFHGAHSSEWRHFLHALCHEDIPALLCPFWWRVRVWVCFNRMRFSQQSKLAGAESVQMRVTLTPRF